MTAPIVRHCGGSVIVPRSLVSGAEEAAAWLALSCENPARVTAERRGDRFASRYPERVSSLIVEADRLIFPAAVGGVVRRTLAGKTYELADERPRFEAAPLKYRGELFEYQRRAVDALLARSYGVALAPCGAGKSEIIAALVGELGLSTLILTPTIDLARDLRARIVSRLGVAAGLIGGGVRDVRPVTIATYAALDAATVGELAPLFGAVIVDEAHHTPGPALSAALRGFKARRFYGLTATPRREDGLEAFTAHALGPVVCTVDRGELIAAGQSVTPRIVEVPTTFRFPYESREDWPPLLAALERDADRDGLIVDVVAREGAGELSAVLVGRVEHAERLAAALRDRGLRAESLTGRRTKKDRERIIAAACAGELDVITATSLADEGLDLPRLSRVVLAWPAKAEGRLVQRVGRCLRVHDEKSDPIVFDIVDGNVGVLRNQARQRRAIFSRAFGGAALRSEAA